MDWNKILCWKETKLFSFFSYIFDKMHKRSLMAILTIKILTHAINAINGFLMLCNDDVYQIQYCFKVFFLSYLGRLCLRLLTSPCKIEVKNGSLFFSPHNCIKYVILCIGNKWKPHRRRSSLGDPDSEHKIWSGIWICYTLKLER